MAPQGVGGLSLPSVAVAGNYTTVSFVPVLDTSAYSTGDALHTADITLTGMASYPGGTGTIKKLVILDTVNTVGGTGELWLHDAVLANTTHTANGAWNIADADLGTVLGVIPFGAYLAGSLNTVSTSAALSVPYKCAAGSTSLIVNLVTRATVTYSSASGMTVVITYSMD